jgi:probable F420-dependent oxidoreductase
MNRRAAAGDDDQRTSVTSNEETTKPNLGQYGAWTGNPVSAEQAVEIEKLGYGAVWVNSMAPADLSWTDPIFDQTSTLKAATGIINIWTSPAGPVAEAFHRVEGKYPGRFLLGIGAGHREVITEWQKPYDALSKYLDELDRYGVPTNRRILAALGDRVLKLSASRGAGAHPYLTTPEHTAHARELLGPSAFLAPENKVVLSTAVDHARELGRSAVDLYLGLNNYLNSWKRLGFSDDDLTKPGSDALIDAVIAYGSAEQIAQRLQQHVASGADHVAVQVVEGDQLLPVLTALAGPLGLDSQP